MRLWLAIALLLGPCLLSGCSSGPALVKVSGQLSVNGTPLKWDGPAMVQIIFVPVVDEGEPPPHTYSAEYNQADSSFTVPGPTRQGIPAGKYRIAVEQLVPNPTQGVHQMNQRFGKANSPLLFEAAKEEAIVVDLGTATVK